jgi:hypothetical protein
MRIGLLIAALALSAALTPVSAAQTLQPRLTPPTLRSHLDAGHKLTIEKHKAFLRNLKTQGLSPNSGEKTKLRALRLRPPVNKHTVPRR